MKQVVLFLTILFLSFGYAFSQEDITQPKQQTDTTAMQDFQENIATSLEVKNNQEDIASSLSSISEGQADDDESANFTPSLLHSSQDVYQNNTSFNFSIAYFRSRGYDSQYQDVCLNGYAMNSMVTGRASFSQWGGLNHVIRWPERVLDMNSSTFTFGNVGGATNYDLRASGYRKQIRASYSISNRTYMNRLMLTAASGIMKSGWSVVGSISSRFGDAITYVQGTSYLGFGAFLGAEKKFNPEHALSLTAFVSPTERGTTTGSFEEVYDLVNSHYYNPNWGWYEGKKRNARVRTIIEPVVLLTHYYTPKNNKFTITSTLGTSFGRNNYTALNWFDAPDPRPDYYRNLPSYWTDSLNYYSWRDKWFYDENTRQIDWHKMYQINQDAKYHPDGPKRAQYMVENRISDHFELGGASNLIMNLSKNIKLSAGIDVRGMKQHNYKTINDLLGGAFWIDIDKFAERDEDSYPGTENIRYNDLDNMGAILKEGDTFGYDYNFFLYSQKAWATLDFVYPKIDFHVGGQLGATEMWRYGLMRNGLFANDSKGKSDVKAFFEGGAKAGITYKITGRNYLVLNGQFANNAPSILNSFLAPRVRNTSVDNLKTEKIMGVDLSYIMKYPFMKMRVSLFFTQFMAKTKVISYFSDGNNTMINEVLTGMNQRHIGAELGAEIKLHSMFSLVLAGIFGDYRYSNNATTTVNAENGYSPVDEQQRTVYWKNFFVAGSPQVAGTFGLKFNHDYWWVNINANYFDRIFCDIGPYRRTSDAFIGVDPELHSKIFDQTRMKGQFTLDVSVSKSWRIKRYTIGFNINVTNVTNNRNLISSAWEYNRFDPRNINKFQDKYTYAYGTTFFAGFNFTFN